eukprot:3092684-Rhodomonas_salina.3
MCLRDQHKERHRVLTRVAAPAKPALITERRSGIGVAMQREETEDLAGALRLPARGRAAGAKASVTAAKGRRVAAAKETAVSRDERGMLGRGVRLWQIA